MSLKCSVFGHVFGDAQVEREREEEGDEVVITVREVKTCSRCGAERVVSENKEVTTLETPSDIVGDDAGETAGATQPASDTAGGVGPDADAAPDPQPSAGPAGTDPDATAGPAGVEADSTPPPEEDDGIILDDEDGDEDDGRDPGEWPEDRADPDGEERAEAAEVVETDPTPDSEAEAETDPDPDAQTEVEPTTEVLTVPEGTFHCPECEFSTPVEDSSLRAGDFCPECRQGALEHERDAA